MKSNRSIRLACLFGACFASVELLTVLPVRASIVITGDDVSPDKELWTQSGDANTDFSIGVTSHSDSVTTVRLISGPGFDANNLNVGAAFRTTGILELFDPMRVNGTTYVGFDGTGTITMGNLGLTPSRSLGDVFLGANAFGVGTVTLEGVSADWEVTGTTNIGHSGEGTLNINIGEARLGTTVVGRNAGSVGTVNIRRSVSGESSKLTTDNFSVGFDSVGHLDVADGGVVETTGVAWIGRFDDADGSTATIRGFDTTSNPSTWTGTSTLYVGQEAANATLHILDRAEARFQRDVIVGAEAGASGTILVGGIDRNFGGTTLLESNGDLYLGGDANGAGGSGRLTLANGGTTRVNSGSVMLYAGGTLEMEYDDQITFGSPETNTLETRYLDASAGTIELNGGAGRLILNLSGDPNNGNAGGIIGVVNSANPDSRIIKTGAGSIMLSDSALDDFTIDDWILQVDQGEVSVTNDLFIGKDAGKTGTLWMNGTNLDVGDTIYIGQSGTGTLNVTNGGTITTNDDVFIASEIGSVGTVNLDGLGSAWTVDGTLLQVGGWGDGELNITNGTQVTAQNVLEVGRSSNGTNIGDGLITVSGEDAGGTDSKLTVVGTSSIGHEGIGVLSISDQADADMQGLVVIGRDAGAQGRVTVTNSRSEFEAALDVTVGNEGEGTFEVINGSSATLQSDLYVGRYSNGTDIGTGTVDVRGDDSYIQDSTIIRTFATLTVEGDSYIGHEGEGTLNVADQGRVNLQGTVNVAQEEDSTGSIHVSGNGSTLTADGDFIVGVYGVGDLNITNGGQVTSLGASKVGLQQTAAGSSVVVDGVGSRWDLNSYLLIGAHAADVTMDITNGGVVSSNDTVTLGNQVTSASTVTVDGAGSWFGSSGGNWFGLGGTATEERGAGTLVLKDGGTASFTNTTTHLYATGTIRSQGTGASVFEAFVIDGRPGGKVILDGGSTLDLVVSGDPNNNNLGGQIQTIGGTGGTLNKLGAGEIMLKNSINNTLIVGDWNLVVSEGKVDVPGSLFVTHNTLTPSVTIDAGELETGSVYIGDVAGSLSVMNGGQFTSNAAFIGRNSGGNGTVTVDGVGSRWDTEGNALRIGLDGQGTLNITDGGVATFRSHVLLGEHGGADGTLNVSGAGSLFQIANVQSGARYMSIGGTSLAQGGNGTVILDDGGEVDVSLLNGGVYFWDSSLIQATGTGGALRATSIQTDGGDIEIQNTADLILDIAGTGGGVGSHDGGNINIVRGLDANGGGTLTKQGAGDVHFANRKDNQNNFTDLGIDDFSLVIEGGSISALTTFVGNTANGFLTVDGNGTVFTSGGNILVAGDGLGGQGHSGKLTLRDGGLIDATNRDITVWDQGQIRGEGTGGQINARNLTYGGAGNGNILLEDGSNLILNLTGPYSLVNNVASTSTTSGGGTLTVAGSGDFEIRNAAGTDAYIEGYNLVVMEDSMTNDALTIAESASSVGGATIEGSNTDWIVSGVTRVASSGVGFLTVRNGATMNAQQISVGGSDTGAGGTGRVNVDGDGSTLTAEQDIYVGHEGTGYLNITNGGEFVGGGLVQVGKETGSRGTILVDGAGSTLNAADAQRINAIGVAGTGTLTVQNGGVANFWELRAGTGAGTAGSGSILVDGVGSELHTAVFRVGYQKAGSLSITDGGLVRNTAGVWLGQNATADRSAAVVDGAGSRWEGTSWLVVGHEADGVTLDVTNGGVVEFGGLVNIGGQAGAEGTVTVSGAGSRFGSTGGTNFGLGGGFDGAGGTGTLILEDGGTASFAGAPTLLYAGGTLQSQGSGTNSLTTEKIDDLGGRVILNDTAELVLNLLGDPNDRSDGGSISDITGAVGTKLIKAGEPSTLVLSNAINNDLIVQDWDLEVREGAVQVDSSTGAGIDAGKQGDITVDGATAELDAANAILVGDLGTGALTITNGGQAIAGTFIEIGSGDNGTNQGDGTVTVSGSGSRLSTSSTSDYFGIGGDASSAGGAGRLILDEGGAVDVAGVETYLWSANTIDVTGSGGTLATEKINVAGGGRINVADNANFVLDMAGDAGGKAGTLDLGSTLIVGSDATVTKNGAGELRLTTDGGSTDLDITGFNVVLNGGDMINTAITIGDGGAGSMTVNSPLASFKSSGQTTVGSNGGDGALVVSDGANFSAGSSLSSFSIGRDSGDTGDVTVTGTGTTFEAGGFVHVGDNGGSGALTVADGAWFEIFGAGTVAVGGNSSIEITGAGTIWESGSGVDLHLIGANSSGSLSISDGAVMVASDAFVFGDNNSAVGTLEVIGQGSHLSIAPDGQNAALQFGNLGDSSGVLRVGDSGAISVQDGAVEINERSSVEVLEGGGSITAAVFDIDQAAAFTLTDGANLTLNLTGVGSTLKDNITSTGITHGGGTITKEGAGDLQVRNSTGTDAFINDWNLVVNQGDLTNNDVAIAWGSGRIGTVTFDGVNSTWQIGGATVVGHSGAQGGITLRNGATATSTGQITLGRDNSGVGALTIDGTGSAWQSGDATLIGENGGQGALTVSSGGSLTNTGEIILGRNGDSVGTLTINDASVTALSDVYVGGDSAAASNGGSSLNFSNVGELDATGQLVKIWSGSRIYTEGIDNYLRARRLVADGDLIFSSSPSGALNLVLAEDSTFNGTLQEGSIIKESDTVELDFTNATWAGTNLFFTDSNVILPEFLSESPTASSPIIGFDNGTIEAGAASGIHFTDGGIFSPGYSGLQANNTSAINLQGKALSAGGPLSVWLRFGETLDINAERIHSSGGTGAIEIDNDSVLNLNLTNDGAGDVTWQANVGRADGEIGTINKNGEGMIVFAGGEFNANLNVNDREVGVQGGLYWFGNNIEEDMTINVTGAGQLLRIVHSGTGTQNTVFGGGSQMDADLAVNITDGAQLIGSEYTKLNLLTDDHTVNMMVSGAGSTVRAGSLATDDGDTGEISLTIEDGATMELTARSNNSIGGGDGDTTVLVTGEGSSFDVTQVTNQDFALNQGGDLAFIVADGAAFSYDGTANGTDFRASFNLGEKHEVLVTGRDSTFTVAGEWLGYSGQADANASPMATFTIADGAVASLTSSFSLDFGGRMLANVTGNGSVFDHTTSAVGLASAFRDTAGLLVEAAGRFDSDGAWRVREGASMTVTGTGSVLELNSGAGDDSTRNFFSLGSEFFQSPYRNAYLTVSDGGTAITHDSYIGGGRTGVNDPGVNYATPGHGFATVTGLNSSWTANRLSIGHSATTSTLNAEGTVDVLEGGAINVTTETLVGVDSDDVGALNVDGTDSGTDTASSFTTGTTLTVGVDGQGTVNITNSGEVEVGTNLLIAPNAGGTGAVVIADTSSEMMVSGTASVGADGGGNGILTLRDGGTLDAVGLVENWSNITTEGIGGAIEADRFVQQSIGTMNLASGSTLTLDAASGTSVLEGTMTGGGTLLKQNAGSLRLINDGTAGDVSGWNLTVEQGHILTNSDFVIGKTNGTSGRVEINGTSSGAAGFLDTEASNGEIIVGDAGTGELFVNDFGDVHTFNLAVGVQQGSNGTVVADLNNLTNGFIDPMIDVAGLTVGDAGTGSVTVREGAVLRMTGGSSTLDTVVVGNAITGDGTLTIDGIGSELLINDLGAGVNLAVGSEGTGRLNVRNGGEVDLASGSVVFVGGSFLGTEGDGTVTISGTSANKSAWESDLTHVGYSGTGSFIVQDGNSATIGGSGTNEGLSIGRGAGSTGTVTVTGQDTVNGVDSTLTTNSELYVGYNGTGTLNVLDGAKATSNGTFSVGRFSTGDGTLNVDGTGSVLTAIEDISIGHEGTGSLSITNGGEFVGGRVVQAGKELGSTGTILVDGVGSILNADARRTNAIGVYGDGTLTVQNGGVANFHELRASTRSNSTGNGRILVDGIGSELHTEIFRVGHQKAGSLSITDGGLIRNTAGAWLGQDATADGSAAVVDGTGSRWEGTSWLVVGNEADGVTLDVTNGGVVEFNGLVNIGVQAGGEGMVTVSGAGSQFGSTGGTNFSLGGSINGAGGTGTLILEDGGTASFAGAPTLLYSGGTLQSQNTGTNTFITEKIDDFGGQVIVNDSAELVLNLLGDPNDRSDGGSLSNVSGTGGTLVKTGAQSTLNVDGTAADVTGWNLRVAEGTVHSLPEMTVASAPATTGSVTVDAFSAAASFTTAGNLLVGTDTGGVGQLNIKDGGLVDAASDVHVLGTSGFNVQGTGGTVRANQLLMGASTSFNLDDGAVLDLDVRNLNSSLGGTIASTSMDNGGGTIRLVGAGTTRIENGTVFGNHSDVTDWNLVVNDGGGAVGVGNFTVGSAVNSQGSVLVDGTGARLTLPSQLNVGYAGDGILRLTNGGTLDRADTYVGRLGGSKGTMTVSGSNTTWDVSQVYVGHGGDGELIVSDGAKVNADRVTNIGADNATGSGSMTITGEGSEYTLDFALSFLVQDLQVGTVGSGTLNLAHGGKLTLDDSDLVVGANGRVNLMVNAESAPRIDATDNAIVNNSSVNIYASGAMEGGATANVITAPTFSGSGDFQGLGGTLTEVTEGSNQVLRFEASEVADWSLGLSGEDVSNSRVQFDNHLMLGFGNDATDVELQATREEIEMLDEYFVLLAYEFQDITDSLDGQDVLLSFYISEAYLEEELFVYHNDGNGWTLFETDVFFYDEGWGNVAVNGFSSYAITATEYRGIPEPGTVALLAMGLFFICGRQRRQEPTYVSPAVPTRHVI